MKHFKNPAKLFLIISALTLVFAFITPFAFHKATAADPELEKKIADKYGVRLFVSSDSFFIGDANEVKQDWTIPNTDKKILSNLKRGSIKVTRSPNENVIILANGKAKGGQGPLTVTEQEQSILITQSERSRNVDLEIQVPANFKGNFELGITRGDVEVENISAGTFSLNTIRGDTKFENVSLQMLHINSVAGEVKVDANTELSANIHSVRGDVKINLKSKPTSTNFTLQSTRGKIENPFPSAQNPEYRIDVTTVNGDIEIE